MTTQVEEYPKGTVFEDVVQELFYQKAMWYFDNKQFDKSLHNNSSSNKPQARDYKQLLQLINPKTPEFNEPGLVGFL